MSKRRSRASKVDELIAELQKEGAKPASIASAARALGELGDRAAVAPLLAALQHIDFEVLAAATMALAVLGAEAPKRARTPILKALVAKLDAGFYPVERDAAVALGELRDGRAVEPLGRKLQGARGIGAAAAQALGRLQDPRAIGPLVAALRGNEVDNMVGVADALVALRGEASPAQAKKVTLALQKAWHHPWEQVRAAMGRALGAYGGRGAFKKLFLALADRDDTVARDAARALAQLGSKRANGPLIAALGTTSPPVRRQVAATLAQLGKPEWQQWVKGETGDYERLAASGAPQAYDLLLAALNVRFALDDNQAARDDRAAAALALGQLGDRRAAEPMWWLLCEHLPPVRASVATALAQLGEPQWEDWIRGDSADYTRLAESGDPRAVSLVPGGLRSPHEADRLAAAEGLATAGVPAVGVGALHAVVLQADQVGVPTVAAAARALGALASKADTKLAQIGVGALVRCLGHQARTVRESAARSLIAIAQQRRSLLGAELQAMLPHWTAHIDNPRGLHCDGPASDCAGDHSDSRIHRDEGISSELADDPALDF